MRIRAGKEPGWWSATLGPRNRSNHHGRLAERWQPACRRDLALTSLARRARATARDTLNPELMPRKKRVVGTAGHIDHGKTSLVRALTGVDTDRLPEEKRRGSTIDLGFASWFTDDYQIAFIAVPGHERFVKNMLAGIGGIDSALLVVAADESINPQTVRHFAIC